MKFRAEMAIFDFAGSDIAKLLTRGNGRDFGTEPFWRNSVVKTFSSVGDSG